MALRFRSRRGPLATDDPAHVGDGSPPGAALAPSSFSVVLPQGRSVSDSPLFHAPMEALMTKRALKRQLREGAFDAEQFEDSKIRRLPIERGW